MSCKVYFGRHLRDFTSLIQGLKSKPYFEMVTLVSRNFWNMTHYFFGDISGNFWCFLAPSWCVLPCSVLCTISDAMFYFFYSVHSLTVPWSPSEIVLPFHFVIESAQCCDCHGCFSCWNSRNHGIIVQLPWCCTATTAPSDLVSPSASVISAVSFSENLSAFCSLPFTIESLIRWRQHIAAGFLGLW